MARGRKKKPDEIKRIEGNPGKRPLNGDAPIPTGSIEKPAFVKNYAAKVWKQIVDSMPPSLYTAVDSVMLASFCVAAAQYRTATEILAKEGLVTYTMKGDEKPHPALSAQSRALTAITTLGARLGLDPASRADIVMPKAPKAVSKFEGLIGSQGVIRSKKTGA